MTRLKDYSDTVLLIPAYNEGEVIETTINAIPKYFKNIICVNDGSKDNTHFKADKTKAQVVSHAINLGQGAALQTAIDYALINESYKYFVTYDADGQHSIKDVEKMLKIIRKEKLDIVLGSRFLGKVVNISTFKKLVLKIAVRFSNFSNGLKLTDTHNGLRVFNRHTAEVLNLQMPDFAHASEILERIKHNDLKYKEVPVTITYTNYSKAKGQSMINAVNILFDVILAKVIRQ